MQVTTIRLDIAKNVFQVHGIDVAEKVVVRKQLRRSHVLEFFKALPPAWLAWKPAAHYWARELTARRPFKVAAVALANKMARVAWALLAKGGTYYRARALVAPAAA